MASGQQNSTPGPIIITLYIRSIHVKTRLALLPGPVQRRYNDRANLPKFNGVRLPAESTLTY